MGLSSCAVVGYKPTQFKFKYNESHIECKRINNRLCEQIVLLHGQGIHKFYIGGSLGVDIWAGEIILRLSELPEFADLEIGLVLSFEGHDSRWDKRSQKRMDHLRRHSRSVTILGSPDWPSAECYRKCNKYIIDQSDFLLAVYNPESPVRGSTATMVKLAQKKGIPITYILPDTGKTLPSADEK